MTTPVSKTTMITAVVLVLIVCSGLGIGVWLLFDSAGAGILVGISPLFILVGAMLIEAVRQLRKRHDG